MLIEHPNIIDLIKNVDITPDITQKKAFSRSIWEAFDQIVIL